MSRESPQIQAIRQRYKQSLPEKAQLVAKLAMEIGDENGRHNARAELHKLAGSSGMYGYNDIAVRCRKAIADIDSGSLSDIVKKLEKLRRLILDQA